ncbi:MAG: hypothetical protein ACI9N1_000282 [Flavobacteriales bacterium]|jgi:hypothetical protein
MKDIYLMIFVLLIMGCGNQNREPNIYVDDMQISRMCISEDQARIDGSVLRDEFSSVNGISPEEMFPYSRKELKTDINDGVLKSSFNISLSSEFEYDYITWKEDGHYYVQIKRMNAKTSNIISNYCKVSIFIENVDSSVQLFYAGVDWYDGNEQIVKDRIKEITVSK